MPDDLRLAPSKRLLPVVALAAAALVLIAVALLAQPPATAPETSPGGLVPAAAPGWTRLPASPLSARESSTIAWTGTEVVVIGGSDASPCPPNADCIAGRAPLRDGAAYDPATREWRKIADAPIGVGRASVVAVAGHLYAWVERIDRPAFLAYEIAADAWRQLPLPAVPAVSGRRLVAWGDRIVAWATSHEGALAPDVAFDPATGDWSEVARDPLAPSFDRWMVAAGDRLVLLGVALVPNPGVEPTFYRAAVLDPASGTWQRLADSEVIGYDPTWYAFGDLVVNPAVGSADGGAVNSWGRAYPYGGILDLTGPAWLPLPGGPAGEGPLPGMAAAAGTFVANGQGWVLDVGDLAWLPLGALPDGPEDLAAVVGAGDRLVAFGGHRFVGDRGELLDAAWEWAPPR